MTVKAKNDSSNNLIRNLIFLAIGLTIFIVTVIVTYNTFTKPFPGLNDFLSRWEGARSYWVDGLNPYSEEASLNIQRAIYGRPSAELEDPGFFAYPFYTVFLLLPIVGISYAWASAIWMVLLEASLIIALIMLFDHFQWKPAPLVLGGLILFTLLSYFPARGLILGQPGLLVYLLEVGVIWALGRKHDKTAGVLLALSTLKPQMGYLIVPLLGLWGIRQKHWQFVISSIVSFVVLMIASFAFQPSWLNDWLGQVGLYTGYTQIGGPVWVISNGLWLGINPDTGLWQVNGGYGGIIEFFIAAIFYIYMLWTWFVALIQRKQERFMWTIVMTLTITHLVAPRTASPHFVVFFIPLIFYLRWLTTTYRRRGASLYVLGILAFFFVQQWAHFLLTVDGEFEHPTIYLPTPILVFMLLLITRKMWWTDSHDRLQAEAVAV
ncbi:MAG: glycosyltransferase family 87 protein [Anaerolineae bacterium]|nr:glycosyltransferase family 87 protein [Anaerolineae bacterium]